MRLIVNGGGLEVNDRHESTPSLWMPRDVGRMHGAGSVGEDAEEGETAEEAVARRPGAQPERRLQRGPLRIRQAGESVERRCTQLAESGEPQLHLALHAGRWFHPAPTGALGGVLPQRCSTSQQASAHAEVKTPHVSSARGLTDRREWRHHTATGGRGPGMRPGLTAGVPRTPLAPGGAVVVTVVPHRQTHPPRHTSGLCWSQRPEEPR